MALFATGQCRMSKSSGEKAVEGRTRNGADWTVERIGQGRASGRDDLLARLQSLLVHGRPRRQDEVGRRREERRRTRWCFLEKDRGT